MTYQETLDYLYSQLPMFQRIGAPAFKKDLTNTLKLCELAGNPHTKFKSVHVAGTNGKGSVTHMIAAALQKAGLKVGIYSSPHLKDFRERIKINGELIEEEAVVDFVEKYKSHIEYIQPSFFEINVVMAFEYFAQQQVDIAVIETGLGGRLDSTNVISPLLSVITNISYDHQQFLGDTLIEIAGEKAGIIKPNTPVVIGETQIELQDVFKGKGTSVSAPVYFAEDQLDVKIKECELDRIIIDIYKNSLLLFPAVAINTGATYQAKNVITSLRALEILQGLAFPISAENIYDAYADYKQITNFRGRWEILGHNPFTLADVAHNPAGLAMVFDQLNEFTFNQKHIVLGMVSDKDVQRALGSLPKEAEYYFCKPDVPRGLDATELKDAAYKIGLEGRVYSSVKEAFIAAKESAGEEDLIYVGGSTFVVAEVL